MAKKKQLTKAQCSKIHFKESFKERFGITINRHDIRQLVEDISRRRVRKTEQLSNRVFAHTMTFKGKECVVLFDRMRQVPVTALTTDMEYVSYSGSSSKHGTERMFR